MKRRDFVKTLCAGFAALFLPVKLFGSKPDNDMITPDWSVTGGGESVEFRYPRYRPGPSSGKVRVYHADMGWIEIKHGQTIEIDGPNGLTYITRDNAGISCNTYWI